MNIKEAQQMYNNTLKVLKDNGFAINKNNKVFEDKTVYVVSIDGRILNEYMGDSDWRYNDLSGDIVITDEQAQILINQILDANKRTTEPEEPIIEASEVLTKIFEEEEYEDEFRNLYCIECAEFYNVSKGKNSIKFSEQQDGEYDFKFEVHKKKLSAVEKFEMSEEMFGCI